MAKQFTIPEFLNNPHFPSLDGLRAISITLVLISHLSNPYSFSSSTHTIFTQAGVLGVQAFFAISGFLITTLLLKEKVKSGNISLKAFYTRRALRILPLVFLYLNCMLVLNSVFHLNISAVNFIGAILFLSNLAYFQGSWYTAHFWSLSIEEQYYLAYPFFLKKFTRHIHLILLAGILLIIFLRTWAYEFTFPDSRVLRVFGFLIYQSDGVLIGSLMAVLCFKNLIPIAFLQKYALPLFILLPIPIWIFHISLLGYPSLNPSVSTAFISIFILCTLLMKKNLIYRFLNNRIVALVGKLSFSIYIWQQLFTSTDGKFGRFTRLPLNILLLALVSACSYYFFEKRFLALKRRFSRDPGAGDRGRGARDRGPFYN